MSPPRLSSSLLPPRRVSYRPLNLEPNTMASCIVSRKRSSSATRRPDWGAGDRLRVRGCLHVWLAARPSGKPKPSAKKKPTKYAVFLLYGAAIETTAHPTASRIMRSSSRRTTNQEFVVPPRDADAGGGAGGGRALHQALVAAGIISTKSRVHWGLVDAADKARKQGLGVDQRAELKALLPEGKKLSELVVWLEKAAELDAVRAQQLPAAPPPKRIRRGGVEMLNDWQPNSTAIDGRTGLPSTPCKWRVAACSGRYIGAGWASATRAGHTVAAIAAAAAVELKIRQLSAVETVDGSRRCTLEMLRRPQPQQPQSRTATMAATSTTAAAADGGDTHASQTSGETGLGYVRIDTACDATRRTVLESALPGLCRTNDQLGLPLMLADTGPRVQLALGPPPLAREGHLQVWLSYRDGTCALHCDEPNGVLICLGGERKVALLPPRVSIDTDAWVGTKPSLRYDVFADAPLPRGRRLVRSIPSGDSHSGGRPVYPERLVASGTIHKR